MNAAPSYTQAIHTRGSLRGGGGSGGRSDSRTPLFPDGLAAFLCLGFPRLVVFYSGGTLDIKRRRIKKRQDSESRQPPDLGSVYTSKTRIRQVLIVYRLADR